MELVDKEVVAGVVAGFDIAPAYCSCSGHSMQTLAGHLGTTPASYSCPGGRIPKLADRLPNQSVVLVPALGVAKLVFPYSTEAMCVPSFCECAQAAGEVVVVAAAGEVEVGVGLFPPTVRLWHWVVEKLLAFPPVATSLPPNVRATS